MVEHTWLFPARILRVVDGDTLDVEIDQGMHTRRIERLRLLGVDTPEMRGPERTAGAAAKAWVEQWIAATPPSEWPYLVRTEKADVFGRYLSLVWRSITGSELTADLLPHLSAGPGTWTP